MKLFYILAIFICILRSGYSENFPTESPEDSLIDNIVVDCSKKANLNCISKNTYRYLENKLNSSENWEITDSLKFERNERTVLPLNIQDTENNRKGRSFEDVTDVIYEQGVRFLSGHDFTWSLPETFFGGTVVKVSTPTGPESRTLFHVELLAPEQKQQEDAAPEDDTSVAQERGEKGRYFLKKLFGKHIKKKLLLGFFALLLIIKLIKIKLFFLLPLILGVGTVKKLAIKFLFFIFPALAALFKSCHHHHHHAPVKQYHLHTVKHQHPPAHHYQEEYHHGHGGGPPDWLRRNEYVADTTAASSWDAQPSGPYYVDEHISRQSPPATEASVYYPDNNQDKLKAAQIAYRAQLQQQAFEVKQRYEQTKASVPLSIPSPQVPMKMGQLSQTSPLQAAVLQSAAAASRAYDPFYSPILKKLDTVFIQMGFNDEPCRERLVCSMYKSPTRFSPHSNLVSEQLSRDPSQLHTPTEPNDKVIRFFKYVDAAKNGQEQKDCLMLYPSCSVNTEP